MSDHWFRQKRWGIGAGVPLNWKGWALFGVYLAVILAVPRVLQVYFGFEPHPLIRLGAVVVISIPFLYVAWIKTEGGWRWRSGDEDTDA